MFYQGKAQSFTSLARVESIEDLPKKGTPYSKRMKSCKSFGGGLDSHKIWYTPKATISKKASRGSFASVLSKRGSFLGGSRPSIAVHKNFWNSTCRVIAYFPVQNPENFEVEASSYWAKAIWSNYHICFIFALFSIVLWSILASYSHHWSQVITLIHVTPNPFSDQILGFLFSAICIYLDYLYINFQKFKGETLVYHLLTFW